MRTNITNTFKFEVRWKQPKIHSWNKNFVCKFFNKWFSAMNMLRCLYIYYLNNNNFNTYFATTKKLPVSYASYSSYNWLITAVLSICLCNITI